MDIASKEDATMPSKLAMRIAEKSNRNLRRAILLAEGCRVQQPNMRADQQIQDLDWELYLAETANLILQNPRRADYLRCATASTSC